MLIAFAGARSAAAAKSNGASSTRGYHPFSAAIQPKVATGRSLVYPLLRRLLFALHPETAHRLALAAVGAWGKAVGGPRQKEAGATVMGLAFPNRIGLAAGLDKDAVAVRGFANLGFGFVEVGTVTPRPQLGNPRPRLFRSEQHQALINRMGFNSAGLEVVGKRLALLRRRPLAALLGVNIGKNRDTPVERAAADYLQCLRAVYQYADYITVNLSSPNTPGLRSLQAAGPAHRLLSALAAQRDALNAAGHRPVPLVVKLSPDLDAASLSAIAAVAQSVGIDGVMAANTTTERPPNLHPAFAAEAGGLSGAPLANQAVQAVAALREAVGQGFPIIGVGGILSADDGRAMFDAGANLVQIYTGLIFRGPELIRELREAAPRG